MKSIADSVKVIRKKFTLPDNLPISGEAGYHDVTEKSAYVRRNLKTNGFPLLPKDFDWLDASGIHFSDARRELFRVNLRLHGAVRDILESEFGEGEMDKLSHQTDDLITLLYLPYGSIVFHSYWAVYAYERSGPVVKADWMLDIAMKLQID